MSVFPSELISPFPFLVGFNVYTAFLHDLSNFSCAKHIYEGREETQNGEERGKNHRTKHYQWIFIKKMQWMGGGVHRSSWGSRLRYYCRIKHVLWLDSNVIDISDNEQWIDGLIPFSCKLHHCHWHDYSSVFMNNGNWTLFDSTNLFYQNHFMFVNFFLSLSICWSRDFFFFSLRSTSAIAWIFQQSVLQFLNTVDKIYRSLLLWHPVPRLYIFSVISTSIHILNGG